MAAGGNLSWQMLRLWHRKTVLVPFKFSRLFQIFLISMEMWNCSIQRPMYDIGYGLLKKKRVGRVTRGGQLKNYSNGCATGLSCLILPSPKTATCGRFVVVPLAIYSIRLATAAVCIWSSLNPVEWNDVCTRRRHCFTSLFDAIAMWEIAGQCEEFENAKEKKHNKQCVRRIPIRDAHDGLPHATLTNQSTSFTIYR
jgi:hypothetical protein